MCYTVTLTFVDGLILHFWILSSTFLLWSGGNFSHSCLCMSITVAIRMANLQNQCTQNATRQASNIVLSMHSTLPSLLDYRCNF